MVISSVDNSATGCWDVVVDVDCVCDAIVDGVVVDGGAISCDV